MSGRTDHPAISGGYYRRAALAPFGLLLALLLVAPGCMIVPSKQFFAATKSTYSVELINAANEVSASRSGTGSNTTTSTALMIDADASGLSTNRCIISLSGAGGGEGLGTNRNAISILEFDDNGHLWDTNQLESALETAKQVGRLDRSTTLLIFVHGWHHNAHPADGNLLEFEKLVWTISRVDTNSFVYGLYVGWRGETWDAPYVNHLTLWDRKSAAQAVAGPELASSVLQIALAHKHGHEGTNPPPFRRSAILMGHSMGGLISERALCPVLLGTLPADLQANLDKLKDTVADIKRKEEALSNAMDARAAAQRYSKELSTHIAAIRSFEKIASDGKGGADSAKKNEVESKRDWTTEAKKVRGQIDALWKNYEGLQFWSTNPPLSEWQPQADTVLLQLKKWQERGIEPADRIANSILSLSTSSPERVAAATDEVWTKLLRPLTARADWLKLRISGFPSETPEALSLPHTAYPLSTEPREKDDPAVTDLAVSVTGLNELHGKWERAFTNAKALKAEEANAVSNLSKRIQEVVDWGATNGLCLATDTWQVLSNKVAENVLTANKAVETKSNGLRAARDRAKSSSRLSLPVDLVVLVNPASESFFMEGTRSAVNRLVNSVTNAQDLFGRSPWLVSITSSADSATKMAFPLAMAVGELGESIRGLRLAPGIRERLQTGPHALAGTDLSTEKPAFDTTNKTAAIEAAWRQATNGTRASKQEQSVGGVVTVNEQALREYDEVEGLVRTVRVDNLTIKNHNDFFNPRLLGFLVYIHAKAEHARKLAAEQITEQSTGGTQ